MRLIAAVSPERPLRFRFLPDRRLWFRSPLECFADSTLVEGVVTSDRLRFWKLMSLNVRARFKLADDNIVEARYGLKT